MHPSESLVTNVPRNGGNGVISLSFHCKRDGRLLTIEV